MQLVNEQAAVLALHEQLARLADTSQLSASELVRERELSKVRFTFTAACTAHLWRETENRARGIRIATLRLCCVSIARCLRRAMLSATCHVALGRMRHVISLVPCDADDGSDAKARR